MGLEDIDVDDPPLTTSATPQTQKQCSSTLPNPPVTNVVKGASAPVDLVDLFGDLNVSTATPVVVTAATVGAATNSKNQAHYAGNTADDDFEWVTAKPSVAPPLAPKSYQGNAGTSNDPLDSFFSQAVPTPAATETAKPPDSSNDLFDFSEPVERVKYTNENTLLEAFANQGKANQGGGSKGPTLADLSKGSSDNVVKARLLKLMNYYDVLGVTPDATEAVIRQRFKKKALELHPDRVGRDQTPEEVELFKVMTKAHEVLTDPEERAKYDAQLLGGVPSGSPDSDWFFPPS
ncbi:chaperone protein DNAj, putative [Trypanosoma equiperdum]|uniref:Chaperone protein DNAJ, putative n=2 Tax=Trypanozoon TaxID=39700 RepID=Q38B97_TRYB2|nr:chaperone protein DnaJ [Trypanosoma brucei brucei TREU927]EAN77923.1 chaperone protein DNAJ, putative [Trypanosoma brucei brucei TREU927]SCU68605.1 chaperone protein DNAj, putative [Trypanosoma equiperdum]